MATTTSAPAHAPSPGKASAPSSPTGGITLSDALDQERRRERRAVLPAAGSHGHGQGRLQLHHLIPACGRPAGAAWSRPPPSSSSPQSQLMIMLHRWGSSLIPKSGAAVARDLEARRRTPSPPAAAQVPPRQEATAMMSVSATERRPLRERVELAAPASAAGPEASTGIEAGKVTDGTVGEGTGRGRGDDASDLAVMCGTAEEPLPGSGERTSLPITSVGKGEGTWLKVSPKKTMSSSRLLQMDVSGEEDSSPPSLTNSPALLVTADDKFVWADKYRPNVLNEFICNKGVAAELHQLVVEHHCQHLIFEGPPAVGKRSMVLAFIRDAFGPDDVKIEEKTKRFELKGEIRKHVDVRVKISEHHVEVNLADLHGYEKYVITTLLNESIPSPNSVCDHTNCKVIVLHDADKLSSDLQHYIGWFLGRYVGCNKIIFSCSNASKLEAVKHLCKVVTLQTPSFDEIIQVLEYIASQEKIYLSHDLAKRITAGASNNLRQAIRSFEATWKANYPFIEDQPILTGWEEDISNLARNIMDEPSPKQLFVIRAKIKKLIEHDVSPYFIFSVSSQSLFTLARVSGGSGGKIQGRVNLFHCSLLHLSEHLVAELKRDKDEEFQHNIDELALDLHLCKSCNHLKEKCKVCKSSEAILKMRNINIEGSSEESHEPIQCFIRIEEFTVRFMSFYRSLISKNSNRGGAL